MITLWPMGGAAMELKSTRFPDGTSQVWKLPPEVTGAGCVTIEWSFEEERELFDLLSLRKLLPAACLTLFVPFLPYSRQDKPVGNEATFNLEMFAEILNLAHFSEVRSMDTHNEARAAALIENFKNSPVGPWHEEVVLRAKPDYLVFPDDGARRRYQAGELAKLPRLICYKDRDQLTGKITGNSISFRDAAAITIQNADMGKIAKPGSRFLIIDDICDGGATFIGIAQKIRSQLPDARIDLAVTHGLFSRGRAVLHDAGIDRVYTYNLLIRNGDAKNV